MGFESINIENYRYFKSVFHITIQMFIKLLSVILNGKIIMNGNMKERCKEVSKEYFKVLSQQLLVGIQENYKNLSQYNQSLSAIQTVSFQK